MARRRYRQDPVTLELIEITEDSYSERGRLKGDASLWNDRHYDNLRATDGADISSRTKHRQYKKAMGYEDFDDYKSNFEKSQRARDEYRQGTRGSVTRDDIARVVYGMFNK